MKTRDSIVGFIVVVIFLIVIIFCYPKLSLAQSLDTFDARAHLPESQIDKNLTYFNLLLQPNSEEKLVVTLTNKSEAEIELKASFNRAITNNIGVIEYSGINEDKSASAPANIEELVTLSEQVIRIEANQSKDIEMMVKMPENAFKGVLAGGLYLEQVSNAEVEGNIKNVFSREIAVLLHNDKTAVAPDVQIERAAANQVNSRNVIEVAIENKGAAYLKEVTIEYQVLLDEKTVVEGKNEQLSIAPNSLFHYKVPFEGEAFAAGTYTTNVVVTAGDKKWEGQPTFTIKAEKAKSLNKQAVSLDEKEPRLSWWLIALGMVLLLLLGGILYLINRNRQLRQRLKKRRKHK
ncbi:DUF916 and DUF3324 domain-containing protein [uncultured Vagococcus sp.]|uniref:DUF916 and DUF3324 domain-containing protein n=1 Tax=uncultured Vagococcus sp. TaxID=189676 RepID=UPI0028D150A8|nr:DUF916 and DUF3324 domain-containing protein [uncultured Vagococcus sp.]